MLHLKQVPGRRSVWEGLKCVFVKEGDFGAFESAWEEDVGVEV